MEVDGVIIDTETGEIIKESAETQEKAAKRFEKAVEKNQKENSVIATTISNLVEKIIELGNKMANYNKPSNFEYSQRKSPDPDATTAEQARYARHSAAENVRKSLFDDLTKQEKIMMQQLSTKTRSIFIKLREELATGLGAMHSAEATNKIDAHIAKVNKMIQDSLIYGIGIPKEKLAETVRKMNSDFAASLNEVVAKQAKAGIMPGPTTDEEIFGFASHIGSISLGKVIDEITSLNEGTKHFEGSLREIISVMDHFVNNEISVQHYFEDIDYILKKDKELEKGLPGLKKTLDEVRNKYSTYGTGEEPKKSADLVTKTRRTLAGTKADLDFDPSMLTAAAASIGAATIALINSIETTEKEIHSIAIISDFTSGQTALFRDKIVELSMALPYASDEIANVYGEIIKTGRGFEEAGKMVEDIGNLAMATFEPIQHIGQNVTALMNAMEMSADKTREVTQGVFNVLSATPLGFDSLAAALTQTGAAFNSLLDTTNKSGAELEEYRSGLMKTQMAMVGGMSLLGKTGSQAGTAIRNAVTRLISMEEAAKSKLDEDLKRYGGFEHAGMLIRNGADLAKLASEDYMVAIEAISKMSSQSVLSFDTMRKLFTGRNVTQIVGVLSQIDGDLAGFNRRMTETGDITRASTQAQKTWVHQWDRLKNMFSDASVSAGTFMDAFSPILEKFNDGLSASNKETVRFSRNMAMSATATAGAAVMVAGFVASLANYKGIFTAMTSGLKLVGISTTAATLGFGALAIALGSLVTGAFLAKIQEEKLKSAEIENVKQGIKSYEDQIKASQRQRIEQEKLIVQLNHFLAPVDKSKTAVQELDKAFTDMYISSSPLLEQMRDFKVSFYSLIKDASEAQKAMADFNISKVFEKQIKELRKVGDEKSNKEADQIERKKNIYNTMQANGIKTESDIEKIREQYKTAKSKGSALYDRESKYNIETADENVSLMKDLESKFNIKANASEKDLELALLKMAELIKEAALGTEKVAEAARESIAKYVQSALSAKKAADANFDQIMADSILDFMDKDNLKEGMEKAKALKKKDSPDAKYLSDKALNDLDLYIEAGEMLKPIYENSGLDTDKIGSSEIKKAMKVVEGVRAKTLSSITATVASISSVTITKEGKEKTDGQKAVDESLKEFKKKTYETYIEEADSTMKTLLETMRVAETDSPEFLKAMDAVMVYALSKFKDKAVDFFADYVNNTLLETYNKNVNGIISKDDSAITILEERIKNDKDFAEGFEKLSKEEKNKNKDRRQLLLEYAKIQYKENDKVDKGDISGAVKASSKNDMAGLNEPKMGRLREIYDEYINIINNTISIQERELERLSSGELASLQFSKIELASRELLITFEESLASAIESSMPEKYTMAEVEKQLDAKMAPIKSIDKRNLNYDTLKSKIDEANSGIKYKIPRGEVLDMLNTFTQNILSQASQALDEVSNITANIRSSDLPTDMATNLINTAIKSQLIRLQELASKLEAGSAEQDALNKQIDKLRNTSTNDITTSAEYEKRTKILIADKDYYGALETAANRYKEATAESMKQGFETMNDVFKAMKSNAEKMEREFITVVDSAIDSVVSGKNTKKLTVENATSQLKDIFALGLKDTYKDVFGIKQRENRGTTFKERYGYEQAGLVDTVSSSQILSGQSQVAPAIAETDAKIVESHKAAALANGGKAEDVKTDVINKQEQNNQVAVVEKGLPKWGEALAINFAERVGPMFSSMINILKASIVEKQLEKIDKSIKKINARQRDLDRKAQMADDIQERVAVFNEQMLLEDELLKLEIERTHLEDMEMQNIQVEKMEEMIMKLNEVKQAVLTSGQQPGSSGKDKEKNGNAGGQLESGGESKPGILGKFGSLSMNSGNAMLDSLGSSMLGMAGGIANQVVSGIFGDDDLGKTLGGVAQGVTGFFTGNIGDMMSGLQGIVGGLFGDSKKEKEIEKKIAEHNEKIAEAVKDFNFQIMMENLKKINEGIHLVAENITQYGLSGAYNVYMNQMGSQISGADAQEYKKERVSYGGGLFRRRRRKTVYGSIAEEMDLNRIGSIMGGETQEALSDSRINGMNELKLAVVGAQKIISGAQNWKSEREGWKDDHGERAEYYARATAIANATGQVLQQLKKTTELYANNMGELNAQMFGFSIEFVDEFGKIAEDSEEIVDVIISGWEGLASILDSVSENMFSYESSLGDSIYEAVLGGVSSALSRDSGMVKLGEKLSELTYEFSKYFIDSEAVKEAKAAADAAGVDFDPSLLVPDASAGEIMQEMINVMNQMKDRENELKEYAQMVSESMLALGGDIKELRPYLGIEFQTMETQIEHYSNEMAEAFAEVQTDYFNTLMGQTISSPEKMAENIKQLEDSIGAFIKAEKAAQDTADAIAQGLTDMFVSGEIGFDFEDLRENLKEEFVKVRDEFTGFLNASTFNDGAASLGSSIGTTITDSIITSLLDKSKYKTAIDGLYKHVETLVDKGANVSFAEMSKLAQETQKYGLMLDRERQKIEAMKSLFDFNSEIVYDTTQDTINYETSSSKESVYNIYQTNSFNLGAFISTKANMEEFATAIAPHMAKAFDNLGLS